MAHRIRLAGFWEPVGDPAGRRYARPFGRPRLGPGERVFLVGLPGPATVNGMAVPADGEITAQLLARNVVTADTPTAAPPADVAVVIVPAG
jgi:hypothetical protein